MTDMQHDERLARRVQAAEDRQRPRANAEAERDAVRPSAMQRMMLRTISPVQSESVTRTEISQVLVINRWKAMQYLIWVRCEATC